MEVPRFHTHIFMSGGCENSPSEGVPTATSTSSAMQGGSCAPTQPRRRWDNPRSCLVVFDFLNISIQTGLLVVFLRVFQDERAHATLQVCILGYAIGCMLTDTYHTYKQFREQSTQLLQVVPLSLGSKLRVGESQTGGLPRYTWEEARNASGHFEPNMPQRFGTQILKWLWRLLDIFFQLWIGVGIGIVFTSWVTRQPPHLNWLCTTFLVITCIPFIFILTVSIMLSIWSGIKVLLRHWPQGAKANKTSILPTSKFQAFEVFDLKTNQANKEEDDVKGGSIGGDKMQIV